MQGNTKTQRHQGTKKAAINQLLCSRPSLCLGAFVSLCFVLLSGLLFTSRVVAQGPAAANNGGQRDERTGLITNEADAFQGYTLISPLQSTTTFLIDMQGRVVKSWETGSMPGAYAVFLENGHLFRAGEYADSPFGPRVAGGGGRIQEYDWNGSLVWDFSYATATAIPHHDFVRLPNGNVVLVVKEKKTAEEAIAAGRIPASVQGGDLQPDALVEIKPTGKTTGEIVWEWHLWDHLIQDLDPQKTNYGDVAAHPERLDLNFSVVAGQRGTADWVHANAVAYNADLDQLMMSSRSLSEIYVIDHSTTTREAAGHSGGRGGKGGDFLYRWGNPRAYRAGTAEDQQLFGQHNPQWIAKGLKGDGHVLVFNNGDSRPGVKYSSVDELVLPVDAKGHYTLEAGKKYGPAGASWSYSAPNHPDFYSYYISGAQRLPNGNTLICSGALGIAFEITQENKMVWQYNMPPFELPARGNGARGGGTNNPRGLFRAYRYGLDFRGLAGKTLTPGQAVESLSR
jgi:hypothetical protein